MSRDRPATWVYDGVWGPCWSWGHTILSVLYCFMSPHAMVTFIAAAEAHFWFHSPTVASVCVGVWVSIYPWRPHGLLRSGVMLVSKGHIATGAVKIWVACTALWGNGDIQIWLLLRIMSGSTWMGSFLKSEVLVGTKGHTDTWCWVVALLVSRSHHPARATLIWVVGPTSQGLC